MHSESRFDGPGIDSLAGGIPEPPTEVSIPGGQNLHDEAAVENKVYVVGVGSDGISGLTPRAREILDGAELLIGTGRLLATIPEGRAERWAVNPGKAEVLARVEAALSERRVVILASGDPGFFGIGKVLVGRLGTERVEIIPHLSSVQLAFARIKESWEDAIFLSVHGRSLEGIASAVQGKSKVSILTDDTNTPAAIARALLANGVAGYRAYVCENLGGPDESVRETDLAGLVNVASGPLNVLILLREEDEVASGASDASERSVTPDVAIAHSWPHGIPDEEFHQRYPHRGLITKLEVRMVSLARLGLRESSVVWDVGAGSGSVAVEAAMIARGGHACAIERDAEGIGLILKNQAKFGARNLSVIHGEAPAALEGLPAPDAVFVGGSGGNLPAILDVVARELRPDGRVVINAATLETAGSAMAALRERGFVADVTLIQVSRGKEVAGMTRFEALNPIFIVAGADTRKRGSGPAEPPAPIATK